MKTVTGEEIKLPIFDPLVYEHLTAAHSNFETLRHQIEVEKIYDPLFRGKKNLTFLDIGANVGLVSLYASSVCSRIVALEPAPETFRVLKSVTLAFPQIECVEAALAPKDGPCEFYQNDINSTASSTVNTYGQFTSVNGLTLGSILRIYQLEHVNVCKCDAEAGEGASLSFDELASAKPIISCFYIETHNCPASTWQHKLAVLVEYFSKLDYSIEVSGMAIVAKRK